MNPQTDKALVTERDVANTLNEPANDAQRIYYPLLARKMFYSMMPAAGLFGTGGTPARRHDNATTDDDGAPITRGERKRAARARGIDLISEHRPLRYMHSAARQAARKAA